METPRIILESTADGSHTLFVPELNEHYHSVNGAWQESLHVFIEAGLKSCEKNELSVFEVGFGTGLNAFLTLIEAEKSGKVIRYTSLELYPLSVELSQSLNYADLIAPHKKQLFDALHKAEWGAEVQITPHFFLRKINADLCEYNFTSKYDVVYFDAFAPEKQPEMWDSELFVKLFDHTNLNGILTTYCAKGVVRRSLQAAGFMVERLQGPPGKREMLRGIKG
ncbi:MAG: tRNA (5-methylaminomethyl-2-thiouridine)(34)-methyltransferase MnmD [Bacteroidales bacterium]|nr:tRNA (5-methylaminomethyl-2-thiouridine)(34)-methyltransferase MnmD [Bacteroidales bacterium]